jgi:hypothetical protein
MVALKWLLIYYLFSAIFFCTIIQDEQVCPADPSGRGRFHYGWLTTIYFASVTMSTVGYGDVSFAGQESWRVFVGIIFMLISLLVGYTVFATAAEAALARFGLVPSSYIISKFISRFIDSYDGGSVPLYKHIRKVFYLRMTELAAYFLFFILIGIFAARLFVRNGGVEDEQWSWMTTFYWAVQTTTTIGKIIEELLVLMTF